MYPLLLSMVFSILIMASLPKEVNPFEGLAFASPSASARAAEAEVYAHNMAVFTEAVLAYVTTEPDRPNFYPQVIDPQAMRRLRFNYLPRTYEPLLPWRAYRMEGEPDEEGNPTTAAVIVYTNPGNLPPSVGPAELAMGLSITVGNRTPVGLHREGRLMMEGLTRKPVSNRILTVQNLPVATIGDRAPAIVVCLGSGEGQIYCN